ncbi:hypothetical protein I7I53_03046 [Histoplasma capsulatum var. duboisii H88]|uniref:Uncharacterized protein n=1 Tax=Ajellomyces capsulatus (strain H88) TaxID=544711 RepID=A0A8A1LP87_AJEC8|nr:hypothetical protein I7I53_03046 [Histoplasma capsulatum var. duboisii H88]
MDNLAVTVLSYHISKEIRQVFTAIQSTISFLPLCMAKRNGQHTNSQEMFMIYGCQLILKEYALQLDTL